jgi:hypothetical protein
MKSKTEKSEIKTSEILQITQIKLKLSPTKEIELTSEEARQVYEELKKLFYLENSGSNLDKAIEELKKQFPQPAQYPIYPYNPPIIIDRGPYYPPYKHWDFWCSTTNATNLQNVNQTSFGAPETSVLFINLTNKTV